MLGSPHEIALEHHDPWIRLSRDGPESHPSPGLTLMFPDDY